MPTNVERLVAVGVLDDSALTQAGIDAINNSNITFTDEELQSLVSVKAKLNFDPLKPTDPADKGFGASNVHFKIWRL